MQWNLFGYGNIFLQATHWHCDGHTSIFHLGEDVFSLVREAQYNSKLWGKIPVIVRFVDNIFDVALVGAEDGFSDDEWNLFQVDTDDFGIL